MMGCPDCPGCPQSPGGVTLTLHSPAGLVMGVYSAIIREGGEGETFRLAGETF